MRERVRGSAKNEWLVTDGLGRYAMGTPSGLRTRKYHGFCLGIPGRDESCVLADLEISLNDESLWPHIFQDGFLDDPESAQRCERTFEENEDGPCWLLHSASGNLRFQVRCEREGVLALRWTWQSADATCEPGILRIRPFFALRSLHDLGGKEWQLEAVTGEPGFLRIQNGGTHASNFIHVMPESLDWVKDPHWYLRFEYPEERLRGYPFEENLFSAGYWVTSLGAQGAKEEVQILLARDLMHLKAPCQRRRRTSIRDFVLREPAGVCAGFPWFGEWGRDTFVSLPGIVASLLHSGDDPGEVASWAYDVLLGWGDWILTDGMLPNLITGKEGHADLQWESADGTLWWCHSLASLWVLSLCGVREFSELPRRLGGHLETAIEAIDSGKHRFLRRGPGVDKFSLLEVTEPYTTWMDARVAGRAVTPRTGLLPEINALWFQARCLQILWANPSGKPNDSESDKLGRWADLMADLMMSCRENSRPNHVFFHSLPLAPSFVAGRREWLLADLNLLASEFATPVGLRTLRRDDPEFRSRCQGNQEERDLAYHQGAVWGWLGGHYEMARARAGLDFSMSLTRMLPMLNNEQRRGFPIHGHIPEIFDAMPPFKWRGAPAQAWSLACLEEAADRRRRETDARLRHYLTLEALTSERRS